MRDINLQTAWFAILLGLDHGRRRRVVLSSRELAGWLRFLAATNDSARTYFVLWYRLLESGGQLVRAARRVSSMFRGSHQWVLCSVPWRCRRCVFCPPGGASIPAPLFYTGGQPDRGRGRFSFSRSTPVKIGLIAMSGVRACDPELVRLGMTLPGFVERGRTIASLPSLGLLTLAGMTPPPT